MNFKVNFAGEVDKEAQIDDWMIHIAKYILTGELLKDINEASDDRHTSIIWWKIDLSPFFYMFYPSICINFIIIYCF